MKLLILFVSILFFYSVHLAAQQSTTGPKPAEGVDRTGHISSSEKNITGQYVIPGVPAYNWRHGCGPTALGMVMGYYDEHGFPDLIAGSSASQTAIVQQMIASDQNYNDYCLPLDYYPNMSPDLSELPSGDEHADNCLADFMKTSRSADQNYYGWSWSSDIEPAFSLYLAYNGNYGGSVAQYSYSSYSFSLLQAEMDANHPMMALVDTDADGYTDHFITIIGYKQESGIDYYGCFNTWDGDVHWYAYNEISSGVSWGIYSLYIFAMENISGITDPLSPPMLYPNPASGQVYFENRGISLIRIFDIKGREILSLSPKTGFNSIDLSTFESGIYFVVQYNENGTSETSKLQIIQ